MTDAEKKKYCLELDKKIAALKEADPTDPEIVDLEDEKIEWGCESFSQTTSLDTPGSSE